MNPLKPIATNFTFVAKGDYFGDVKARFSSNWKRNMKRSLRHGLKVTISRGKNNVNSVLDIYNEMVDIKQIPKTKFLTQLEYISHYLGEDVVTFVVKDNSQDFSVRVVLVFGNKAFDFLAETTILGRKNYASYFVVNEVLEWCADNQISFFDFSGVDPKKAKGVYNFKKGTGAKLAEYIGEKERASSSFVRILCNLGIHFRRNV